MESPSLIEMTTEIVTAHVANNPVTVAEVPMLVRSVHEALASVGGAPAEAAPERIEPAVSVRASVKTDHLTCLVCGRKQKTLRRHLEAAHGMTAERYRAEFDLPKSYPMVAPEYSKRRGDMARRIGLGRKDAPFLAAAPEPEAEPARGRRTARKLEAV